MGGSDRDNAYFHILIIIKFHFDEDESETKLSEEVMRNEVS